MVAMSERPLASGDQASASTGGEARASTGGDEPESGGSDTPAADPAPGDRAPGDRRPARLLDAPPSERYTRTARADLPPDDDPSPLRGIVMAILVAGLCGLILVVLGGAFDFTAGLIVVAFFLGRLTATAMRIGAGPTVTGARLLGTAVGISLVAVVVAQLALWGWARWEGGSLGPVDFLAQTYGVLVILQLLLAGGAAWLKAS
jgi:hypothetical protein